MTPAYALRLRFRGHTLLDRVFAPGCAIRIGEDPRCDVIVPGCGAMQDLVADGGPKLVRGLVGPEIGDGLARYRSAEHPDIEVEVMPTAPPRPGYRAGIRWWPTRELAYGLSLAGCLAALVGTQAAAWARSPEAISNRLEQVLIEMPSATLTDPRRGADHPGHATGPHDPGELDDAGQGQPGGSSVAPDDGDVIGVAACDRYLTVVRSCASGMLDPEGQKEFEAAIDDAEAQWREISVVPEAHAALEEACRTALETIEPQLDLMGCGELAD